VDQEHADVAVAQATQDRQTGSGKIALERRPGVLDP
jgi:hypothetical protein